MPSAARVVALAHAKRCRCQVDGPLTCAECDGQLHVTAPRAKRQELLRDAAIEAARGYVAAFVRWENAKVSGRPTGDLSLVRDDAMQTMRDALAAERRARHG